MMERYGRPITPDEALDERTAIPEFVYEVINRMIVYGHMDSLEQLDVAIDYDQLMENLWDAAKTLSRCEVRNMGWDRVLDEYKQRGWDVVGHDIGDRFSHWTIRRKDKA